MKRKQFINPREIKISRDKKKRSFIILQCPNSPTIHLPLSLSTHTHEVGNIISPGSVHYQIHGTRSKSSKFRVQSWWLERSRKDP